MPRYAQLVMGPAGSGKSTYCSALVKHCESLRRTVRVVNLDPAAENFDYPIHADIRELVSLDDVMEDETLRYGPNGGLVFCMEFLAQNMEWLEEQLGEDEDDYYLFDCPGQIELYTHVPVMKQLVDQLQHWNFAVCGVFLIDAQFMIEASKFVSGVMCALSAMVQLEIPHVNILSKLDLLNKKARKELERYLDPDMETLLSEELHEDAVTNKYKKLNAAIASVIDNYSLVRFVPLDITEEESINDVLVQIDSSIQYGEDMEPKEMRDEDVDEDEAEDGGFFD